MVVPLPLTGMRVWLPMHTFRFDTGVYEIKANLWGIMWLVAQESATRSADKGVREVMPVGMLWAAGLARRYFSMSGIAGFDDGGGA